MTDAVDDIRRLSGVLAFYADRLDRLRAPRGSAAAIDARSQYLFEDIAEVPYTDISPWYKVVEPIYGELDGHLRAADRTLCDRVFADPEIRSAEPKLHRLRAAYEYDKEADQARALLADRAAGAKLARLADRQSYWTLPPTVGRALAGCRNIAVLGAGPLPLTALAIASAINGRVACVEIDPVGSRLGARVIALSPHAHRIRCIAAGAEDLTDLDNFDAVVATVLLGVSLDGERHGSKAAIVGRILERLPAGAPLILRDPYGLGRLLYPTADLAPAGAFDLTRIDPARDPQQRYRSSFIILHSPGPKHGYAQSGTVRIHP